MWDVWKLFYLKHLPQKRGKGENYVGETPLHSRTDTPKEIGGK